MYGIFDTLGAIAKNPNNNSRMLFFGIPKGTFYKKLPLAGFGAKTPRITCQMKNMSARS